MRVMGAVLSAILSLLTFAPAYAEPQRTDATTDDIFEAVVRYQVSQFLEGTGEKLLVCLSLADAKGRHDPSDEFMVRFEKTPMFRKGSACIAVSGGIREAKTEAPAVLVTLGPIEWFGSDETRVKTTYYRSQLRVARPVYRVVKEQSRWVTLGPVIQIDVA
jgi:hypothetical protein